MNRPPFRKYDRPGKAFETYTGSCRNQMLPNDIVPFDEGSFDTAILTTNDIIPENLIPENKPNGTLFGLGFGGVFGMVDFFESEPESILLFDITPEPVEIGHACIQLMADEPEFRQFLNSITYLAIPGNARKTVDTAVRLYRMGSDDRITWGLKHIHRNYKTLHRLAMNGNIGISLGDIFAPKTIEVINEFKDPEQRHLLYVTDAPQFGLDCIDVINPALDNTWFVDTETPYNENKGIKVTTARATYGKLPGYDDEYRSYLR